jgi:hypothetical protein
MTDSGQRLKEAQRDAGEEKTPALPPEPHSYKEIRAEQFTLVDAAGAEHARLRVAGGGAVLTMMDSRGRPRLRLRAGDNEATITVCGERGDAGKGVLPADDGVERVMIGYDSAAQDPRIVIKDGNENGRATLTLDDGCAGLVLVETADGCACMDERGLVVLDGDSEVLARYQAPEGTKARTGATPETEPATIAGPSTPERPPGSGRAPQARVIDDEAIRNLVDRVIPRDDDEAAKAFISLIHSIAYNDDRCDRDNIALYASVAAYQRTFAHSEDTLKFIDAAQAEFPLKKDRNR